MRLPGLSTRIPLIHVLHLRTFAGIIPWIIVLNTVAAVDRFDVVLIGSWLAIHSVTLLVAGLPVFVTRAVMLRRGVDEVGLAFVIIAGIVLGVTKGSLTSLAEVMLGFSDEWAETVWLRSIGASVAAVWLLLLTAYARTGLERLERSRAELVRQNVATRLATQPDNPRVELQEPLHQLTVVRREVAAGAVKATPGTIRQVVDHTIRPLSRALWSVENSRYPAIRVTTLFRLSLESGRFPALAIALVWASLSFTALTVQLGVVASFAYNLATALVALVVWRFAGTLISRIIPLAVVIISVVSVAVVTVGSFLASMVVDGLYLSLTPVIVLFGAIWMTFVVIGASTVSGAMAISELIQRDLARHDTRNLVDSQADSLLTAMATRELATTLHGEVQSRLLGLAAAIDQGRLNPREVLRQLDAILDSLRTLQKTTPGTQPSVSTGDALEQLEHVQVAWRGLMQIVIDEPSERNLVALIVREPDLVEIIREALSNAHRHGNATLVEITVGLESDEIVVRVMDNGYGPRLGTPGLGTALLDRYAHKSWSLTRVDPSGAQLEIRLPVEVARER